MSHETWNAMHKDPAIAVHFAMVIRSMFSQGGVCFFDWEKLQKHNEDNKYSDIAQELASIADVKQAEGQIYGGREGFVGWMGFGGSVFQWHPEMEIGFGFVPFDYNWVDNRNTKAGKL
jgi:hypothetical protein